MLLAVMLAVLATVSTTTPAAAQTPPFTTYLWAVTGIQTAGSGRGTVVVGDSLVLGTGPQSLANVISDVTGRPAVAQGAGGASYVNYVWPGEEPPNGALISSLAAFFKPSVTVIALGTNDQRIMQSHPAQYSFETQRTMVSIGVSEALKNSRCVLLVNVPTWRQVLPTHPTGRGLQVNFNLLAVKGQHGNRVRVADWNARSNGQHGLFEPNDVHHTLGGSWVYADFIAREARAYMRSGHC